MDVHLTMSAPLDVEIDIISKCQLDCSYCSAAPLLGHEIDTDRAVALIEEMGRQGVFSLYISGGEPTIHSGFIEILAAAASNIPMVTVSTNGIKLSRASYARQVHRVAPNVCFSISLDSTEVTINNLHRGAGGSHAIKAINNCCDNDQPVCISCVLTESNLDTAESIIDMFHPDVESFRYFPRVPRTTEETFLNTEEYWLGVCELTKKIELKMASAPNLKVILPSRAIDKVQRGEMFDYVKSCCCAFTKLYVDSRLNVYPCYYSASLGTLLGNVALAPLSNIWNSSAADKVRERSKSECLCGFTFLENVVPTRYLGGGMPTAIDLPLISVVRIEGF
jgi:MoaA/NifB/PqqE/SkfB family radical SAM enzyme